MNANPNTRSLFSSPHLYRNPKQGKLLGVCAGLAEHIHISPRNVRIGMLICVTLTPPPALALYVVLALTLPIRPNEDNSAPPTKEDLDRRIIEDDPDRALTILRDRFRAMERRIIIMESHASGKTADLDQRLRALNKNH
ncbi:phage shock protein C [Azospirillaceae bacterium]